MERKDYGVARSPHPARSLDKSPETKKAPKRLKEI